MLVYCNPRQVPFTHFDRVALDGVIDETQELILCAAHDVIAFTAGEGG